MATAVEANVGTLATLRAVHNAFNSNECVANKELRDDKTEGCRVD